MSFIHSMAATMRRGSHGYKSNLIQFVRGRFTPRAPVLFAHILSQKFHGKLRCYVSLAASLIARTRDIIATRKRGLGPSEIKFEEALKEPNMELFRDTAKFAHSRAVVECAQCGEHLFVPEWSEFVDARRVRHLWECEACGYAFETTIRFAAA